MTTTRIQSDHSVLDKTKERRLAPRHPVGASFNICIVVHSHPQKMQVISATMRDLSDHGIGLEITDPLDVDVLLTIPIAPPGIEAMESLYRVVRSDQRDTKRWAIGAELICTDPDDRIIQLQLEAVRIRRVIMESPQ